MIRPLLSVLLLASLTALHGATPKPNIVYILAADLGADKTPLREAVVHHSINGMFSIRQGSWKLELCAGSGGWGKPGDADAKNQGSSAVQLYDLSADVAEAKNVHAEHSEIVTHLTRLLETYVANGPSAPGASQRNDVSVKIIKPINAKALTK